MQHLQNQIVKTSDTPARKGRRQLHGISEILQAGDETTLTSGLTHTHTCALKGSRRMCATWKLRRILRGS